MKLHVSIFLAAPFIASGFVFQPSVLVARARRNAESNTVLFDSRKREKVASRTKWVESRGGGAEATMQLCLNSLQDLAKANIVVPNYDRSDITPGILQVGVGNFHRSHVGAYVDDLLNTGESNDWGIVGAGMYSAKRRDDLEPQDWLQTLVERDGQGAKARVIGSMVDFLPVQPGKHTAMYEKMLEPDIKIVSLLLTEGGYFLSNGSFDPAIPDIKHDIENPDEPKTIFGVLVKALKERKNNGIEPFTVMSCDNLPHNGDVVKSVVVGLAALMDTSLAEWIEDSVAFPNSMVDRITPATSENELTYLRENFDGLKDVSPVFCEPFRQWVLEDKFCSGRPPLEQVGVQFVPDVTPYETMKIRILNGGHASLCYPSALLGVGYVHESMEHPTIGPFLDCIERNEIIPTVPPVPDTDLQEYWKIIAARFSNPTIMDTIDRNCYDGFNRQPKFIVPVVREALEKGESVDGLALVSAMWCRYCQGQREDGSTIEPNDPIWDKLQGRALKAKEEPAIWLEMQEVYGDVGKNLKFVEAFTNAMKSLEENGVEDAMKKYIESKL